MTTAASLRRSGALSGAHASRPAESPFDAVRLANAGLIIISISNVHQYLGPVAALRPAMLSFLLVVVLTILNPRAVRWENLTSTWPSKVVLILASCAVLSVPFGLSMGSAANFLLTDYSKTLLTTVALIIAIRNIRDLKFFVCTYVLSVGIIILLALTVMDTSSHGAQIARLQTSNMMYDSNDLGVLFMVALPLAIWLIVGSKGLARYLGLAVALLVPVMVAITGSRGALVGLVGLTLAFLLLVRDVSWSKKIGGIVAGIAMLTIAAPAGYWEQMETILNPAEDYNVQDEASGRVAIMKRGMGYLGAYPVFGVGVGGFARAENMLSPLNRRWRPGDRMYVLAPHNTLLQVAVELGVIALIVWLGLFVRAVVATRRLRDRILAWRHAGPDRRFLYAGAVYLPIAFIGFLVPSVFVSHAYLPSIYILIALLAALLRLSRAETMSAPAGGGQAPHRAGRQRAVWPVPAPRTSP